MHTHWTMRKMAESGKWKTSPIASKSFSLLSQRATIPDMLSLRSRLASRALRGASVAPVRTTSSLAASPLGRSRLFWLGAVAVVATSSTMYYFSTQACIIWISSLQRYSQSQASAAEKVSALSPNEFRELTLIRKEVRHLLQCNRRAACSRLITSEATRKCRPTLPSTALPCRPSRTTSICPYAPFTSFHSLSSRYCLPFVSRASPPCIFPPFSPAVMAPLTLFLIHYCSC